MENWGVKGCSGEHCGAVVLGLSSLEIGYSWGLLLMGTVSQKLQYKTSNLHCTSSNLYISSSDIHHEWIVDDFSRWTDATYLDVHVGQTCCNSDSSEHSWPFCPSRRIFPPTTAVDGLDKLKSTEETVDLPLQKMTRMPMIPRR